jgi:hypothetical protein
MIFDWTISLGNLITVFGFAMSGIIFVMLMRTDIRLLSQRVGAVEKVMENVVEASLELAKQGAALKVVEDRINAISRRVDILIERGQNPLK